MTDRTNESAPARTPAHIEALIADLVEWVAAAPRSYDETMAAWRTSCPRLTIWEDALDRGYVRRERISGGAGRRSSPPRPGTLFSQRRDACPARPRPPLRVFPPPRFRAYGECAMQAA